MTQSTATQPDDSDRRFHASRWTLFVDRFMTRFVKVGGIAVIVAVAGIFVFILAQILPLFRPARLTELDTVQLPAATYRVLGVDEWTELPFLVDDSGSLRFVDLTEGGRVIESEIDLGAGHRVTAVAYLQQSQQLACGTDEGNVTLVNLNYRADFGGEQRRIVADPKLLNTYRVGLAGQAIQDVAYADAGDRKLIAAIQKIDGQAHLHVVTLRQKRSLMGAGKVEIDGRFDLTQSLGVTPLRVLVSGSANSLVVTDTTGDVVFLRLADGAFTEVQRFRPFEAAGPVPVASIDYLLGQVSLVLTSVQGEHVIYSLHVDPETNQRLYGLTKRFPRLPGGAEFFTPGLRNKAFLIGTGSFISLRYATTQATRVERELPYEVERAVIASKYDRVVLLGRDHRLHVHALRDPHPEAGFAAFFRQIWYEGYGEPGYHWQSTGGTDDFETKLSMLPLIVGTLKGTFFAMLFAVPIALLGALYCSQFQHPRFKAVVKPTMEIMASLPSVVLGFLAALWLAPIVENRVPSLLLIILVVPVAALLVGWLWSQLPRRYQIWCPHGYEFIGFAPIMLLLAWGAWELGPVVERWLFVVKDPETGSVIADFRLWWPMVTGTRFEQRNSLVVGFIMGFAVIPIIFTITEDSLSNVPKSLTSAALALGATRWQTAIRVVLPTASAGLFSACMIGLGRAVGETMIVLMATGNTAVMDMNIFTGMRTLSANIAVELPEAPHGGTLYRTLFLGAFILFLMTFVVNTLAEILRQHLRNKYKTV